LKARGLVVEEFDPVVVVPKSIDNSRVVRQVDPRLSRDLWLLVFLVGALVAGLVLYAWPHLALRQTGLETAEMARERERLVEENRKLRLEKAALEDLRRVEAIAARHLHLVAPPAERVVMIEKPAPLPDGTMLAREQGAAAPER
jgi:cell division protein FtsL